MSVTASRLNSSPNERATTWNAAADRVAVVVNGNAKQVTDELVEILDQIVQSGDLFVSRSLEEGQDIARSIVERGYPTVLTGGGDGTFVQMVTWICAAADALEKTPPRFGLLRLGTGNALAWVLGAQKTTDKGVVTDLARLRREGGSRKIRLIDIEGTLTPFAGLGADATCLKHYNQTKELLSRAPLLGRLATGKATYFATIIGRSLPEFMLRHHPRVKVVNEGGPAVRVGVDGRAVGRPLLEGEVLYDGPSLVVAMSTIPYWGFGARFFPYAGDRDDRFHLRIADITPAMILLHARGLWKGTYRSNMLHDFLVDRVRIEYAEPMPMQIGGDLVGSRTEVVANLSERPIDVVDYYAPPPLETS